MDRAGGGAPLLAERARLQGRDLRPHPAAGDAHKAVDPDRPDNRPRGGGFDLAAPRFPVNGAAKADDPQSVWF